VCKHDKEEESRREKIVLTIQILMVLLEDHRAEIHHMSCGMRSVRGPALLRSMVL